MIDIKIAIHHGLDYRQLSYHQNYDGGEYEIEYREYMYIVVDNVSALDFSTISILDNYENIHNRTWIEEDVSWFDVCNNDDCFDRYDNEEQSKSLLTDIVSPKYKFIILSKDNTPNFNEIISSFTSPYTSNYRSFFSALEESDKLFETQIQKNKASSEDLVSQLEQYKTTVDKKLKQIEEDIICIEKNKYRKRYDFYSKAIIEGKFCINQKINEYNKFPIELAILNGDTELFYFLLNNVSDIFYLSEKYNQKIDTFLDVVDNIYLMSFYKHNNKIFIECCDFLLSHNDISNLFIFLNEIIKNKEQIQSVSPDITMEIQLLYFIVSLNIQNLGDIILYLNCVLEIEDSKRFCNALINLLADEKLQKSETDIKESKLDSLVLMIKKYGLLQDVNHAVKSLILCILREKSSCKVNEVIDLGLPSGIKWSSASFGFLLPYYDLDMPCNSKEILNAKSSIHTYKDTVSIVLGENWELPEIEDYKELIKYCDWNWQEEKNLPNGNIRLRGYEVIGRNDERLFFRASGYVDDFGMLQDFNEGFYWTKSKTIAFPNDAIGFVFDGQWKIKNFVPGKATDSLMIRPIKRVLGKKSFRDMLANNEEEDLCSHISAVEEAEAIIDEFGVKYTKDCSKLIKTPKDIHNCTIKNGTKVLGRFAFSRCKKLELLNIPNSVKIIGKNCFMMCSNLKSVSLTSGVTKIEERAFAMCRNLQSIVIPDSIVSIGDSAFWDCQSLINISIPNSVTRIGNHVFKGCSCLTNVELSNNVSIIGEDAFYECTSLKRIIIPRNTTSKFQKIIPDYSKLLVER